MWDGPGAVVFFFVLSGYVLALPFYRGPVSCPGFLARRICRIYAPYWITLAVAALACQLAPARDLPGYGSWLNATWNRPISVGAVAEQTTLVDTSGKRLLAPVAWSLVHEMRISLVFPLLMIAILRWDWKVSLLVSFTVPLAAVVAITTASALAMRVVIEKPSVVLGKSMSSRLGSVTAPAIPRAPTAAGTTPLL